MFVSRREKKFCTNSISFSNKYSLKFILTIFSEKYYMGDVTSHPLANQAEACLFGRSLNTSLSEIYDLKAAFLLVKTVVHKNFNLHIWKKTYRYYRFKL